MWVQCILCDRYVEIDDETTVAKHFKKRPDFAFLCSRCGGGLGHLEKNALLPGVRPEEVAAGEREVAPAFAAWSEPKPLGERLTRRGDGAAPRGGNASLPQAKRGGDHPRREGDRLRQEGHRPQEGDRPHREGDRPRQEGGRPRDGDRSRQEGPRRHGASQGSGQPGQPGSGHAGQPGQGHQGRKSTSGKPHHTQQQGGGSGPERGADNSGGQSGSQPVGGGGRHQRRRGHQGRNGERPQGGPTQAGSQSGPVQQRPRPEPARVGGRTDES